MSDELPEGWGAAKLGALVADSFYGPRFSSDDYVAHGVPTIRTTDMDSRGRITLKEAPRLKLTAADLKKFGLIDGDLLVTRTGTIGRCALYTADVGPAIPSAYLIRFRLRQEVLDPRLAFHFMQSPLGQSQLGLGTTAVAQPNINAKTIGAFDIPLPPLPEQRRIVTHVEALLEQVNRAKGRLDRVPLILNRFRQSVLAAACSGELTKGWRNERGPGPSAAGSLDELFAHRLRKYERAMASARANGGKKPTTPKNLEPAKVPDGLAHLPDGWAWVLFDDVCDDITVGHVGPMANEYVERGIPFLRSQNVRPFRFDPHGLKFVTRPFHERLAKSALKPGDLVVVRSGNAGEACVVPPELSEANCADLVVMRPSPALDPKYGAIFINSSAARAHIDDVKVGIAQGHYNIGSARETPVPLPSLAEQVAIVKAVDRMFALADTIEGRVQTATARAERLPQAILSKAFSGELVPNEAELARVEGRTYETAEALLARVLNESSADWKKGARKPRRREKGAEA